MSGNWAEYTLIERNIERSVTLQWWGLQTWTLRRCGAAYIVGGRKISASLVKWTKWFLEAHNLPRGFFVFELLELLEESFQPYSTHTYIMQVQLLFWMRLIVINRLTALVAIKHFGMGKKSKRPFHLLRCCILYLMFILLVILQSKGDHFFKITCNTYSDCH